MFWPRMKLTPGEERLGMSKYYDHERGVRGVLRKAYGGQLILNAVIRNPVFTFQIARRCRVFALTASGDIPQFKVQIQDSSGEQYVANPTSLSTLLGGYAELPPPPYGAAVSLSTGGIPPTAKEAGNALAWPYLMGAPKTYAPYVMEPNIVLDSNQSLTITGIPLTDYNSIDYRVDFVFHIWEFPGWKGGPA